MKEIRGKNVTVVGLARSGIGSANLLGEFGAKVTVTDRKTEVELRELLPKLNPSVRVVLGSHPEDIFLNAEMIIVSPGVSLDIQPLLHAKSKKIPILGELELAYEIIGNQMRFLAVTGTNGKSTTTALLDFMMKKGGFRTMLGGNIGNALTEEIHKLLSMKSEEKKVINYAVAEISSFQLESIKEFKPKVAAIVNITPDHLDRYHSLEEYSDAKARLFENQDVDDFLVLNRDDAETMRVYKDKFKVQSSKSPKTFFFSRKESVNGIYSQNGVVHCSFNDPELNTSDFELIRVEDIKIKGVHNLENAMAASAMALLAGCSVDAVIDSLREFPGLEHRLEFVRELDGVSYFNDSKGTNVGAVTKSLESFSKPVVLIAGGRDKAGDFSQLRELVRERVKALILIGEAREKIRKALGDITETLMAKELREAVEISRRKAVQGDVILLSPACASFDMFEDFEDRGRQFKKIVRELQ